MYQISVKRDGFNPLTGSARYRVTACQYSLFCKTRYLPTTKTLFLGLSNPRKVGTIINPRKELFGND